MKKKSLESIYNIQLEDFAERYSEIEKEICTLYSMYNNPYARIYKRNVSIAFCDKQQSDNYLYEYIINDNVVAIVYSRRNDFNTIDLMISLFDYEDNIRNTTEIAVQHSNSPEDDVQ